MFSLVRTIALIVLVLTIIEFTVPGASGLLPIGGNSMMQIGIVASIIICANEIGDFLASKKQHKK